MSPTAPTPRGPTAATAWVDVVAPRDVRRILAAQRAGPNDPTTRIGDRVFRRATLTPEGPATLVVRWSEPPVADLDAVDVDAVDVDAVVDAEAWGPGAGWALARVDRLTARDDRAVAFPDAHPVVARALRLRRRVRLGASDGLYHLLLPTVIAQRITGHEAGRQWLRLCRALGEAAPGPAEVAADLLLPPDPAVLNRRPAWWFHPLGIETKRARTITEIARHADKLWRWTELGRDEAAAKLPLLPGVGPWTVGSVLGPAFGDPDTVPVGDYHMPHVTSWALAGEPRGDDDRMLELLEPYRGQRWRVLAALLATAGPAPKFGPRQRVLPMQRW